MKSTFRQILAFTLAVATLLGVCACGTNPSTDNSGRTASDLINQPPTTVPPNIIVFNFTIDASEVYASGKLSEELAKNVPNGGKIITHASVSMPKGTKLSDIFEHIEKLYRLSFVLENNELRAAQGIENGSCGEGSHWELKVNESTVTSIDTVELKSGDNVELTFIIGE